MKKEWHDFTCSLDALNAAPADAMIEVARQMRHAAGNLRRLGDPDGAEVIDAAAANLLRQSAPVEARKLTKHDQDEIAVIIHDHRMGVASDNIAYMVVEHVNKKLGGK